jgi:hypothetical protein
LYILTFTFLDNRREDKRILNWKRREQKAISLLLHPSLVQIFSLEPCSQTPSLYALPLVWETTFTPIQSNRNQYYLPRVYNRLSIEFIMPLQRAFQVTALWSRCLRGLWHRPLSLGCWDRGVESRLRQGYLSSFILWHIRFPW